MAESKSSEWTAAWIEQQRELLRKQAASAAADASKGGPKAGPEMTEEVRELGEKWRALGQSYLSGLAQHSQTAGQAGAHFKIGDELLNVWRSVSTVAGDIQKGAVGSISDLLARLPPIGPAREHTEAWRELAASQAECQRLEQELRAVLLGVQGDALTLLEQRLSEPERNGEPPASYRDLYDLWVDCAEQVYSKVAHSEAYCKLQAQLGNASMRLRSRQQKVIEHGLRQFDLPTRSELNSVHRQLREQKQRIADLELKLRQAGPATSTVKRERAPAKKAARQPAGAVKKKVVGKPVARKKGRSR